MNSKIVNVSCINGKFVFQVKGKEADVEDFKNASENNYRKCSEKYGINKSEFLNIAFMVNRGIL